MLTFMVIGHVLFLHAVQIRCSGNSTAVSRLSVPENHHVCLRCDGSDTTDVIWTHQDRKVPVSRRGSYETNEDRQRYLLLLDGSLCLLRLEDSDGGTFHCNQQLVAELQVLTGRDFAVSAGRTLLLPCSSSKPKKRWFHQRAGGKWEVIFTRFRNGTAKPERSRLSFGYGALQIQDLQPEDAGEYLCNRDLQTRLTVLSQVQPETISVQPTTSTTAAAAAMATDEAEIKKEERPENVLLMVAVVGLALMVLLMAAVCVLLTSMRCRRKKKRRCAAQRPDDTELQPWTTSNTQTEREVDESPSLAEETIHYASLGRQNWRERPSRTPPDQNHHHVIYSSVITRPAAKPKRCERKRAV